METLKNVVLVLDLISAVLLTIVILVQSGKSAGLTSALAGASDSFMAKGGSKTLDAKLARATKWLGLLFVLLSLLAVILINSVHASAKTTTPATDAPVISTGAIVDTTGAAADTTEAVADTTEAAADTTEG